MPRERIIQNLKHQIEARILDAGTLGAVPPPREMQGKTPSSATTKIKRKTADPEPPEKAPVRVEEPVIERPEPVRPARVNRADEGAAAERKAAMIRRAVAKLRGPGSGDECRRRAMRIAFGGQRRPPVRAQR